MPKDENKGPETEGAMVPAPVPTGDRIGGNILIGDQEFKVKQQVNVPTLKHDSGKAVTVRIELPIRFETSTREEEVTLSTGEIVKGTKDTQIAVVRVTELTSGLAFNYVCNAITASELNRAYPDNAYVGKCFAIRKLGVVAGKRYKGVEILEIEPTSPAANAE